MFPQQSHNCGIGKDRKLTAAKATLQCSLPSPLTPHPFLILSEATPLTCDIKETGWKTFAQMLRIWSR